MRTADLSPLERALHLLATVRPGEGRSILLMVTQVYLLLLAYYLIRPLREALILAEPPLRGCVGGVACIDLGADIPCERHLGERDREAAVAASFRN